MMVLIYFLEQSEKLNGYLLLMLRAQVYSGPREAFSMQDYFSSLLSSAGKQDFSLAEQSPSPDTKFSTQHISCQGYKLAIWISIYMSMCVCLVQLMTSARKGDMEGRHGFLVVSKGRFQQNKCQQWARQTSLRSQRKNSMQLSWHWARALQLAKSIQSSEGWTRPIWRFVQQVVWPTSYRNIFVGCKPPVRLWASGLAWRTNIADGGIAYIGHRGKGRFRSPMFKA